VSPKPFELAAGEALLVGGEAVGDFGGDDAAGGEIGQLGGAHVVAGHQAGEDHVQGGGAGEDPAGGGADQGDVAQVGDPEQGALRGGSVGPPRGGSARLATMEARRQEGTEEDLSDLSP